MKAVVTRLISVAVGFGAAKLAAATGIVVDPVTQGSIVLGVYAGLHKLLERVGTKPERFGF